MEMKNSLLTLGMAAGIVSGLSGVEDAEARRNARPVLKKRGTPVRNLSAREARRSTRRRVGRVHLGRRAPEGTSLATVGVATAVKKRGGTFRP